MNRMQIWLRKRKDVVMTIGDKIRVSNESLAKEIADKIAGFDCGDCKARKFGCSENNRDCYNAWVDYLNQSI